MPGVKAGAYSFVGPGVLLCEGLPDGKIVLARQELSVRDWGRERFGW